LPFHASPGEAKTEDLECFCFSLVGSGVDVSNEFDIKIDHTEDQYLSINEQVKKDNPGYLFYLVINNKASNPLMAGV
jgi:hypothetical protein